MSKGKTMTVRQEKWCFITSLIVLFAGVVCTVWAGITNSSLVTYLGVVMCVVGFLGAVLTQGKLMKRIKSVPSPPRPPRQQFKN